MNRKIYYLAIFVLLVSMLGCAKLLKGLGEGADIYNQGLDNYNKNENEQSDKAVIPKTIPKTEISCSLCDGTGQRECRICQGSGNSRGVCSICNGRRIINGMQCGRCHGRGFPPCETCKGRGLVKCSICNGKGYH
ncbi:MAG: hypothetical protein V1709_06610 [Planctomycetota bacterium]